MLQSVNSLRLLNLSTYKPFFGCFGDTLLQSKMEESLFNLSESDDSEEELERLFAVLDPVSFAVANPELSQSDKNKLSKIQQTPNLLKSFAKSTVNLDNVDKEVLKGVIKEALKNQPKKPEETWNERKKLYAIQIFNRFPKAYSVLRKLMPLPTGKSIQRLLESVRMDTGIDSALLKQLQDASDKILTNKKCTLLFDTMSLEPNLSYNESADYIEGYVDFGGDRRKNEIADKAVVFMIQGIGEKFKQPVAYYFVQGYSPENLAGFIKEVIKAVEDVGFTIVTVVCDHGPTNCEALTILKKSTNLPPSANHFLLNGKKYFTIYDVPSLYTAIRNKFYEAGAMKFDGKVAKWQHLRDFEAMNREELHLDKITPAMLDPKDKMKKDVKLAAQTLSNTFGGFIKLIAKGENKTELADTGHVLSELDKLFDSTNGPANGEETVKGQRENVSLKTNHVEIWDRFLGKLSTLEFMKSDSKIQLERNRIVEGYKITINSLKDIWELCKNDLERLSLRQLNQDSLQKLFDVIRECSTDGKPTCAQFASAVKYVLISGLSAPGQGPDCNNDVNKMLFVRSLRPEELKI